MGDLSATDISNMTGVTKRSVLRRAKKEAWPAVECAGRGGRQCRYPIDTLPDDIRAAYYNKVAQDVTSTTPPGGDQPSAPPPAGIPTPTAGAPAIVLRCGAPAPAITRAQQDRALAKAGLCRRYIEAVTRSGWGNRVAARASFMEAYNSGLAFPTLYQALGPIPSWKTIEGWKRILDSIRGDAFALADQRGYCHRGKQVLTDAQKEIVLKCALHPNKPKISEAIRMAWAVMHAQGVQNGQSMATYRRFLNDWRSRNHHIWVFTREGAKAWNDQCAYYIERDYSRLNVGDVIVADGHVLNFEILNPFTGKPKRMTWIVWYDMKSSMPLGWEIMPSENTAAISSALRWAIIRLGKIPQVAYLDNGKAFGARFFGGKDIGDGVLSGLYERIGIQTIHAWAYHGQSKTVERFFGTFAELERWAPTYCGTSIEDKPPRMMRGERLHRRVYERVMGDQALTLEQAHRAIASWVDAYATRKQQGGHLAGLTPMEVFLDGRGPGVDRNELTHLMMAEEDRMVHRNGIKFLGKHYFDPALYGYRRPVTIRYDLQDLSAIYVFDAEGHFLCTARPPEQIHPAAQILGTAEDQAALEAHIKIKKRQEREASAFAREFLEHEVLPQHRIQIERMGIALAEKAPDPAPVPVGVRRLRKIEADQAAAGDAIEAQWQSERDQVAAACRRALTGEGGPCGLPDMDRYCDVFARFSADWPITAEENDFMVFFGESEMVRRYPELFNQLGIDAYLAGQETKAL